MSYEAELVAKLEKQLVAFQNCPRSYMGSLKHSQLTDFGDLSETKGPE